MNQNRKSLILMILDGWGISPPWGGNAISVADTPNFDYFWAHYPKTTLAASGKAVGLPGHEMGNSEVGHLNLGAGRIVPQDISVISKAISDGSFFQNRTFLSALNHVARFNSSLHLMGLVSSGGIHSHIDQLFALLRLAKDHGIGKVFIHAFTDGRDSEPMSAISFISALQEKIKILGLGEIATISGRFWAMDRDNRWNRTQVTYNAIVDGVGQIAKSPIAAITQSYNQGSLDEFIPPVVIIKNNQPVAKLQDNDAIIFFNFRVDRARQITKAIMFPDFNKFSINNRPKNIFFVSMVPYEYEMKAPNIYPAFYPSHIKNTLTEILSYHSYKQLHIAETEKYAHVTYFFNGAHEKQFLGEDRILIPSPKVTTYDLVPEMSAGKITAKVLDRISKYDFILINYANCDMVGHTGNMDATIKAVEAVDEYFGQVVKNNLSKDGITIVTADHGNAEEMINIKNQEIFTEHTTNPVPIIIISNKKIPYLRSGILADVSPTILDILRIHKPKEFTGKSLFDTNPKEDEKSILYHV